MSLFTKLRDFFGDTRLRNKPGGLAWIRFPAADPCAVLNGQIVKTIRPDSDGCWDMEPAVQFVTTCVLEDLDGRRLAAGTHTGVLIPDEFLIPIPDAGLSKSEVSELYRAGPVRRKEHA